MIHSRCQLRKPTLQLNQHWMLDGGSEFALNVMKTWMHPTLHLMYMLLVLASQHQLSIIQTQQSN